ncbi:MAG: hypothetical protein SGBAC_009670 [Bacillariaceae sp.]
MAIDFGTVPDLDNMVELCFEIGKCTPLMATILDPNCNSPREVRRVLDNHNNFSFLNRSDPLSTGTPIIQLACSEKVMPQAPEIVEFLLEPKYGVDIHARSGPLQCLGSTQIVKILIDHGADLLSSAPHKQPPTTPMNVAIQNNSIEIVALLVNASKKTGRLKEMLLTINRIEQTSTQVAMCRRRTEIIGIMARAAGDLRCSFYGAWDENPFNEEKYVYAHPNPKEFPEAWALYQTVCQQDMQLLPRTRR